jgi:hypothetical protein
MLTFFRESEENESTDLEVLNERGIGENRPLKSNNF